MHLKGCVIFSRELRFWRPKSAITKMDCLEQLSKYFFFLSAKYNLKLKLEFETFDCDQLTFLEKETLSKLKDCLPTFEMENGKDRTKLFCKVCKISFAHQKIEHFHDKVTHRNDFSQIEEPETIFCCVYCNKCFKSKSSFESHQNCQSSKIPYPEHLLDFHSKFSCGICHVKFKQLSRIKFHLESCQELILNCDFCQTETFRSQLDLSIHLASNHRSQVEKPFQCNFCPCKFKLKTSYQKHVFKTHQGSPEDSFQCDTCPKKFIKKVYLTNHKLRFHQLKKEQMCPNCGEFFLTEGTLRKHLKSHENPQEFQCSMCEKTFKRKDKLKNHLSIHTGEKPFSCEFCPKKFITKAKLKDHERRHFGEKRFSCLLCTKLYAGSHDLRKHLEKMHPKVAKNIQPNVPLTPQIIASLSNAQE